MELDKIIPLQETPKTPYQTSIAVPILRFRWIHAQCFQFELPGGKILMTDPFFPQNPKAWKEVCTPAFDADELGKVDYVTINHSHFDHTANLPDLFKQARPTVICDRIFARELSAAFQVPEACIRPIVPGLTYHFDDFTLNTFSGNHTDLGTVSNFDGGKMFADPENANGVHARPAGLLVKAAKALDSTITLENAAGKSAVATKLMAVMGLGIKQGDTVTVTVEGGDEEASAAAMEKFFSENL